MNLYACYVSILYLILCVEVFSCKHYVCVPHAFLLPLNGAN